MEKRLPSDNSHDYSITTMSAGSWGCPHEVDSVCSKINNLPCDPGMKGCVLFGRFRFANDDKNERLNQKQAQKSNTGEEKKP